MALALARGRFALLDAPRVALLEAAHARAGPGGRTIVAIAEAADLARPPEAAGADIPVEERVFTCQNVRFVDEAAAGAADGVEADLARWKPAVLLMLEEEVADAAALRAACERAGAALELLTAPHDNAAYAATIPAAPQLRAPRPDGSGPVVFVSGCYDLLHSGHIAFFNEAASLGDLYVSIGNDANILRLKHHSPMFPELERLRVVAAIKSVKEARVCSGSGMLDFEADLDLIKPDIFFVNEDGHRESKAAACAQRGIEYRVGSRKPSAGLAERSSTALKAELAQQSGSASPGETEELIEDLYAFPWRICLAGGWLDQPWVSQVVPGSVIVVNVMPHEQFKTRSGLATSTRTVGMRLWGTRRRSSPGPPRDEPAEELAKMLFGAENPPGCKHVAGSQDALGLMLPGINRLDFDGQYWPHSIEPCPDLAEAAAWLERVLWLVPLPSRPNGYDPLLEKHLTPENVSLLADASARAWAAILGRDAPALGKALSDTMVAWRAILPYTVPQPESDEWCAKYRDGSHGCLFSGCGGGFLLVISDDPVPDSFKVRIKTSQWLH